MHLLIDNHDSFTHNLVQLVRSTGHELTVWRADDPRVTPATDLREFESVLISPGPKEPQRLPGLCSFVERSIGRIPMLGVCLGHETIAYTLGGSIVRSSTPMHGRTSRLLHSDDVLFHEVPSPIDVARYHSLEVVEASLPTELEVIGRTQDGTVMAIAYRQACAFGVQFHPESFLTQYGRVMIDNFFEIARTWSANRSLLGS